MAQRPVDQLKLSLVFFGIILNLNQSQQYANISFQSKSPIPLSDGNQCTLGYSGDVNEDIILTVGCQIAKNDSFSYQISNDSWTFLGNLTGSVPQADKHRSGGFLTLDKSIYFVTGDKNDPGMYSYDMKNYSENRAIEYEGDKPFEVRNECLMTDGTRIFLIGGASGGPNNLDISDQTAFTGWRGWREGTPLETGVMDAGCAYSKITHSLYVFGGKISSEGRAYSKAIWKIDVTDFQGQDGSWTEISTQMTSPKQGQSVVTAYDPNLHREYMYILGGSTVNATFNVNLFDPSTETIMDLGDILIYPVTRYSSVVLKMVESDLRSFQIIILGGSDEESENRYLQISDEFTLDGPLFTTTTSTSTSPTRSPSLNPTQNPITFEPTPMSSTTIGTETSTDSPIETPPQVVKVSKSNESIWITIVSVLAAMILCLCLFFLYEKRRLDSEKAEEFVKQLSMRALPGLPGPPKSEELEKPAGIDRQATNPQIEGSSKIVHAVPPEIRPMSGEQSAPVSNESALLTPREDDSLNNNHRHQPPESVDSPIQIIYDYDSSVRTLGNDLKEAKKCEEMVIDEIIQNMQTQTG